MILRPYQIDNAKKIVNRLNNYKLCYFAAEVRTGKTLTSLEACRLYGAKKVIFLTKKKAISSIENDYENFGYTFDLTVINNESLHKIKDNDFDLLIMDEAHRLGSYPKPSKMAKDAKKRFSHLPIIYLSGTPHPETLSQIYHQLWISNYSPFKAYKTFYKWAKEFVDVYKIDFGYGLVNSYEKAKEQNIQKAIKNIIITFSQKEAGFTSEIDEHVLRVTLPKSILSLIKRLKDDLIVEGKNEVILADTAVKLQNKIHQLSSGTIKFESGNSKVLSTFKAEFIKERFKGQKIGIFYKFKEELNAIKQVFDSVATSVEDFDNGISNVIALQMISGREGISLRNADSLIFYNIDFSATTYWQAKDRMTTKERLKNDVYWIFSDKGIEQKIYQAVSNKKDYTSRLFKKDYGI